MAEFEESVWVVLDRGIRVSATIKIPGGSPDADAGEIWHIANSTLHTAFLTTASLYSNARRPSGIPMGSDFLPIAPTPPGTGRDRENTLEPEISLTVPTPDEESELTASAWVSRGQDAEDDDRSNTPTELDTATGVKSIRFTLDEVAN